MEVYGATFFSIPPFKLYIDSEGLGRAQTFYSDPSKKSWVGPNLLIHRNHIALINFQHESHQLTPPVLKLASQPNPPQKQGVYIIFHLLRETNGGK